MSGEPAVWHRWVKDAGRDSYNRPIGTFRDSQIQGALFAPGGSSESGSPRTSYRVTTKPTLYLLTNPGIGPHDEFTVRGDRYVVDGDIDDWATGMSSWNPGCEVALKKVTG